MGHVAHAVPEGKACKGQRSKLLARMEELLTKLDACSITVVEMREISDIVVELELDINSPTLVKVSIMGTHKLITFGMYLRRFHPLGFKVIKKIYR